MRLVGNADIDWNQRAKPVRRFSPLCGTGTHITTPRSPLGVKNADAEEKMLDLKKNPFDLTDAFRPELCRVSAETEQPSARNGFPFRAEGHREIKQKFRRLKLFFLPHGLFPQQVKLTPLDTVELTYPGNIKSTEKTRAKERTTIITTLRCFSSSFFFSTISLIRGSSPKSSFISENTILSFVYHMFVLQARYMAQRSSFSAGILKALTRHSTV